MKKEREMEPKTLENAVNDSDDNLKMNRRKALWAVLSVFIAMGSIALVLKKSTSFELDTFVKSIRNMDAGWILLALISMFGYIWFEGLAILRIAETLDLRRKKREGMVYGAADVYFSAITPSASGGQPASAFFMIKDGMKASAVAIILLFNLIFYCIALLSVAAVCFLLFGDILVQLSIQFKLLFGLGLGILVLFAVVFYLLIHRGQIIFGFCDRLVDMGERLHLIRNGQKRRKKLQRSMKHYHECAGIIGKDRRIVRDVFLYNVLQRLSQLGVCFCIFMAWKKELGPALQASAIQCFVAVGSNSVPIPGGMGVADYLMLHGFSHLMGDAMAVNMELICRGITFYGCVLTGGIITLAGYVMRRMQGAVCTKRN